MDTTSSEASTAGRSTTIRRRLPIVVLAVALFAFAAACNTSTEDRNQIVGQLNSARAAAGVGALAQQTQLNNEADRWAQEMRNSCTLAHRPDLTANLPAGWTLVGENVGVTSQSPGESDAEVLDRMHASFMGSGGHRANIVNGAFTMVGVGAVKGGCDTFGSGGEYWVVHIFITMS